MSFQPGPFPPPPGLDHPPPPLPIPESNDNQFYNRFEDYKEDETLGAYMFRKTKSAVHQLWKRSHTVARIDLIRPSFSVEDPYNNNSNDNNRKSYLNEQENTTPSPLNQAPGISGAYYRSPFSNTNHPSYPPLNQPGAYPPLPQQFSPSPLPPPPSPSPPKWYESLMSVQGINKRGARLKLMQVWHLGNEEKKSIIPKTLNFGVGLNFDMDRGVLEPKLRLRTKNFVFHCLPHSGVEIRKRIQVGRSNLAIDFRYKIPIDSSKKSWIGDGGGLRVQLFNPIGTGLHLSPRGLEFDEQIIRLGKHTGIRLACWLGFARQIPLPEGQTLADLNVSRLGIKTNLS